MKQRKKKTIHTVLRVRSISSEHKMCLGSPGTDFDAQYIYPSYVLVWSVKNTDDTLTQDPSYTIPRAFWSASRSFFYNNNRGLRFVFERLFIRINLSFQRNGVVRQNSGKKHIFFFFSDFWL